MNEHIPILMADDDPDDCFLIQSAFEDCGLKNPLRFVHNGVELMNYLLRRGKFGDILAYPLPGLILLDLNMPKKDGREALAEIKANPDLCHIPVIILTTSKTEDDVHRIYQIGANCFITKPSSFEGILEIVRMLSKFWLGMVALPFAE